MSVIVDRLCVEYESNGYVVRPIDGLSLRASPGELVVLLGASGCGKTTLLSVLAGILRPRAGSVLVGDVEVTALAGDELVRYRRTGVGIVFQAFNLVPSLTAQENVEMPMRFAGVRRAAAGRRAAQLLASVGLEHRGSHRPGALSGGQQQRVAIARALALEPPLVLADEPTAHLDYVQVEGVLGLLRGIADAGRIVVVATHDERLLPLADRVVELTPRPVVSGPDEAQVVIAAGDVLFRQGESSDFVYVIEKGRVEIVRELAGGGEETLATLGAGRHLGELGPLLGLQRSATARAKTRATLRAYTPQAFRSRVRDGAPAGQGSAADLLRA